jgi:hypothetical protein
VTTPAGVVARPTPWVFRIGLPLKRSLSWNWFVPIARVGSNGAQYQGLAMSCTELTVRKPGRLFLYVNDGVLFWPMPVWHTFYDNNQGVPASVTVERLARTGDATCECAVR